MRTGARFLLLAVVAAVSGGQVAAQTYTARRLGAPLIVDGDTGELRDAPFIALATASGTGAVRLAWDDDALYVTADVTDEHLNALILDRDGKLFNDDSLEILFCTRNDRGATDLPGDDDYKFFVNLLNVQADSRGGAGPWVGWDATWRSTVSVSGSVNEPTDTDVGYGLELLIRWADWGVAPPRAGDRWGLEVALNDLYATGAQLRDFWVNSNGGSINDPDGWGTVIFSECGLGPHPCPPPDDCRAEGTCVEATGLCQSPALPDETSCAGGTGSCRQGECVSHGAGDAGVDASRRADTDTLIGWSCGAAGGAASGWVALAWLLLLALRRSRGAVGQGGRLS